ncbi:ATP-binding cassette domain-containing protein [Salmonella enterica]|nr:ATP-binding cassette domain-containing protein [Salmonella enterica]
MLSLQQVTLESARYRWYGTRRWSPLLQNVSFDIAPGEMVALVGGSGEGKSLLLQCLLDLLPENLRFRGEITLDGNRLDRHTIRQLRGNTFSYVPQMVQLLQQSDLEPTVLERFPRQLSGGMAKRILACHASLSQARYILADEITAWLDTALANQLLEHLRGLCERGCGVLWVTHDLLLAARYADRIVALHQGYITDNIRCEQLQPEEMSEPLKRQWQALPELNPLFMPTGEGIEC